MTHRPKATFPERPGNGLVSFVRSVTFWAAALIFAFVGLCSLVFTAYFDSATYKERVLYKLDNPIPSLLVLAALVVVCYWLVRLKAWQVLPVRRLQLALLFYALVLGTVWVLLARTSPMGEAANVTGMAHQFQGGQYDGLAEGAYAGRFPYQLGYIAFAQLVFTFFGTYNYLVLQLFNVACTAVAYYILSDITRLLFDDEAVTFTATLLLFGCLWPVIFTPFAYGNLPGLAMAVLALWFALKYVRTHAPLLLAGCALAITVACVLKSNYTIFLVAIVVLLLAEWVKTRRKALLLAIPLTLALCLLAMPLIQGVYARKSSCEVGKYAMPTILWVAMGLSDDSKIAPGWYNVLTYLYDDPDEARAVAQERIDDSLAAFAEDPAKAGEFFFFKIVSQWNEPTAGTFLPPYEAEPATSALRSNVAHRIFNGEVTHGTLVWLMDRYHFVVYAGAFFGLWFGRRKLALYQLIPAMVVVGGFLFHLVWEAKSQYIIQYYFLCIPYAALGLKELADPAHWQWAKKLAGRLRKAPR